MPKGAPLRGETIAAINVFFNIGEEMRNTYVGMTDYQKRPPRVTR